MGIGCTPNVSLEVDGGTANGSIARFHNENARYLEISAESDGTYDDAITVFKKNTSVGQYAFRNSQTEFFRLDASGNLLVGKTATNYAAEGVEIRSNEVLITKAGLNPLSVRNNGNGGIISLNSGGTTVGTIGSISGTDLSVESGGGVLYLGGNSGGAIRAINDLGSGQPRLDVTDDATTNLGSSSNRFKDLYLSGGVYLGGTGAANKLDDYEEGTWTPVLTGTGYSFGTHTGRYVKVGNLVYITALFNVTTIGSNNSIIGWSGAPFTTEAVTNLHQMGVVRESSTTGRLYQIQINAGSSGGSMNSMDGITGGSNEIFTTGNYAVSVTYKI